MKKTLQKIFLTVLVFLLFFSIGSNAQARSPKSGKVSISKSDATQKAKIPASSIKLKRPALMVKQGGKVKCIAHVLPKNASRQKILYQSLTPKTAKVSAHGIVTGLKPGIATILCTAADSPFVFTECTVTVGENERQLVFRKYVINLSVGEQKSLIPHLDGKPDKKNIIFTSGDPGTVSVNDRGNVTALKPGTVVITAAAADNPQLKTECTIRVTENAAIRKAKTIFVGASRTARKKRTLNDTTASTAFITKSGARFRWFSKTAVKKLRKRLDRYPDQRVVLCMGVNDMQNVEKYIYLCMELIFQYPNTPIYVSTVTPIDERYSFYTNHDICRFNNKLKNALGDRVIDTYAYLKKSGYNTVDGIHYDRPTSARELNYILDSISDAT